MRPVRVLLGYLVCVFLIGPLLAPWVYWLVHYFMEHFSALKWMADYPFKRYVTRCTIIVALLGLWPLLRGLGITSWQSVGVTKPAGQWHRLFAGFALGFVSLAVVAALGVLSGSRLLDEDSLGKLFRKLPGIIAATVGVAATEELLFRGVLFGAVARVHRWVPALILSSVVYAMLHFFQKVSSPPVITWSTGLETVAQMFHGFVEFRSLVPGLITLTLAGVILGLGFRRTGNLYFSIGLHAGWIFWLRFYGTLTDPQRGANTWFWGSGKLYDGWLALVALLIALAVVCLWPVHRIGESTEKYAV